MNASGDFQKTDRKESMANDTWLQRYISESIQQRLCTTIGCTTCGAGQFRNGYLKAYADGIGKPEPLFVHRECALGIAEALTYVEPLTTDSLIKFEEAARCLLFDLWYSIGKDADEQLTLVLEGTWAGTVLESMKTHYQNKLERQRAIAESQNPVLVERRKEEKRRLKQERHRERLSQKKERDRVWFGKQEGNGK
jgi:hypothetical protein